MIFGSKVRRAYWWNILVRVIPECIVAGAASVFLNGGVLLFVGIVIGFEIYSVVHWVLGSIVDALIFKFSGRRQMSRHLADYLRENGYPEPQFYEDSTQDYLIRVKDDAKLPVKVRLCAAIELGTLGTWHYLHWYAVANRLEMAWEDALVEYKRSFPPEKAIEDDSKDMEEAANKNDSG